VTLIMSQIDLHSARPLVYLDQWVWFRLAKADLGEPRAKSDLAVLAAVRQASEAGIAFPLSATHYMETSKITNPAQRAELARTMASISRCRTLRSRSVLLRHQMLNAMYLTFGRPAFRPEPPEVLGTGVLWAFTGRPGPLTLRDSSGRINPASIPGMPDFLRKANQLSEASMLAGPADEEPDELRASVTGLRQPRRSARAGSRGRKPTSACCPTTRSAGRTCGCECKPGRSATSTSACSASC
jgi:hypothetical protein